MSLVDTLMILLFPIIDVIPFALPRYWLYRDKLRLPFRCITMLLIALSAVYSAVFYYINLGGAASAAQWTTIVRYTFMLVFLAMAFLLIRDSFPKLMFTWLLYLFWQFFVLGNANYIESKFFWDFSDQHPYLIYNIARIIIYIITCPFLLRFFNRTIARALEINDPKMWRHLWKVPLFSMLFGMLYCTVTDVYAYASWQFLVSRYLMLLGVCYVSYVALKVMENSSSRACLESALRYAGQSLLAQKKQYDSLSSHMEETRRARHDLRQHLTVVSAIVCYYATLARENQVTFQATIDYPKDCPITATDITVLLGNLLENAVEACRDEAPPKRINLRIKPKGDTMLLVLVDNTATVPVRFADGTPISSKREGFGLGVASVRSIADSYGGSTQFEQEAGMFLASVLLHLKA